MYRWTSKASMSGGTVERTLLAANSVIPRLAVPVLGIVGEKASSAGESVCFAVPPVRTTPNRSSFQAVRNAITKARLRIPYWKGVPVVN